MGRDEHTREKQKVEYSMMAQVRLASRWQFLKTSTKMLLSFGSSLSVTAEHRKSDSSKISGLNGNIPVFTKSLSMLDLLNAGE